MNKLGQRQSLKCILGPKSFLVQKSVGSRKNFSLEKNLGQKNCGSKQIFGQKDFRLYLSDLTNPNFTWPVITWSDLPQLDLTFFWSNKIFGQKKFWIKNKFEVKKISDFTCLT